MDIATVLLTNYPDTKWMLDGDDYEGLEWSDESPKPTKKTLEDAWPAIEHDLAVKAVENARSDAYRVEADGLFFQYQRGEATEQEWLTAVQAVKTAHPYPEVVE